MRMNTEQELSAYEVVNSYDEAKLAKIFLNMEKRSIQKYSTCNCKIKSGKEN